MKNIANELTQFFEETGVRQCRLAQASGVSSATISRIVSGKQVDLRLSTATDIRSAMEKLRNERQPPPQPGEPASPDSMTAS